MKSTMMKVFALVLALLIATVSLTALAEDIKTDETAQVALETPNTEDKKEETVVETAVEAPVEVAVAPGCEATVEPVPEASQEPTVEPTVEPSVEPSAEPTTEPTVEPTEEQTEVVNEEAQPTDELPEDAEMVTTLADKLNPDRSIEIYATYEGDYLNAGDKVTLYAVLKGYDNLVYSIQWQRNAGQEWENISGEDGKTYDFTLTEENYEYAWRVIVSITDVAE